MPAGTELQFDDLTGPDLASHPRISACHSRPGKVVFIEADNTDGWIATDIATEPPR